MKTTHYKKITLLSLAFICLTSFAAIPSAQAGPQKHWRKDHHRHYSHNHHHSKDVYYYPAPRKYVYYKGNRGYWESRSGIQLFIRIN